MSPRESVSRTARHCVSGAFSACDVPSTGEAGAVEATTTALNAPATMATVRIRFKTSLSFPGWVSRLPAEEVRGQLRS